MNKIKELRIEKGLKQSQLASFLNTTQANVSGWENAKWEPDKDTLLKLADYFNVSVDYLLGRTEKLVIPENLNDVQIAFYDGVKDLTQEEIDEVSKFVDYIKSRKK